MLRGKSALPLPRYITPASINIGDTVRVEWGVEDITHTRTAVVASREYEGGMRVFCAPSGNEIFRWHPAHKEYKVTLLAEAKGDSTNLALFDMTEMV